MYRAAAYSNVGIRRKTNQDSCCVEVALLDENDAALLAVCDGVGGLAAGELASTSAVRWLTEWFETDYVQRVKTTVEDVDDLFDWVSVEWERGLLRLNDLLRIHGRKTGTKSGTTFTAILLCCQHYFIGHVGDTRVYRFAQGDVSILTDDQTWVAREMARGNITPEQARNHPKKNVILQAVGTQNELMPVFKRGKTESGDAYLVCCDGFRNELFDDELKDAFGHLQNANEEQMTQQCERLARLAMSRGETDNITCTIVSLQEGTYGATQSIVDPFDSMMPIAVERESVVVSRELAEPTTQLDEGPGGERG